MKTINDATTWIASQPEVDPNHIGLMGVSLGSYLGLTVASQDSRIKAVVEFFGGIPDLAAQWSKSMPPVLILHGSEDPIVPVSEAYKLEKFLRQKNTPYQMHIYPGEGHGFNEPANQDSRQRALEFFQKYLGSPNHQTSINGFFGR
jgi:carboxymethylenebutenolidase